MEKIECVFIGRRELNGGKTGEAWITLAKLRENLQAKADKAGTSEGYFAAQLFSGLDYSLFAAAKGAPLICGIYEVEVEVDANGKLNRLGGTKRFTGRRFEDEAFNAAAYAEDKAVSLKLKGERQLAKAKGDNLLEAELRSLRELYRKTSPENRLAVEVLVLKALRNGI